MTPTGFLWRRRRRRTRGQSLVEFALTLPVLMLTLVMALDFGRVFLGWINLNNTARIAANYAAQHPDAWAAPNLAEQARYAQLITNDVSTINCTLPSGAPAPTFPDGNNLGGRVQVRLTCNFQLLTPLVGSIVGNPLTVNAQAVFPIRTGIVAGVPVGAGLPPLPSATPTPTPTPSPSPGSSAAPPPTPSPTPTPAVCIVPKFTGEQSENAQSRWAQAGFITNVTFVPVRPPEYTINGQSLVIGSVVACNSAITVYDKHQ